MRIARRSISLAFRYWRSREDAEEITQDVRIQYSQGRATSRGDAALSSWIYRIDVQRRDVASADAEVTAIPGRNWRGTTSPDGEELTQEPRHEPAD
jgi:hypothetical protein